MKQDEQRRQDEFRASRLKTIHRLKKYQEVSSHCTVCINLVLFFVAKCFTTKSTASTLSATISAKRHKEESFKEGSQQGTITAIHEDTGDSITGSRQATTASSSTSSTTA